MTQKRSHLGMDRTDRIQQKLLSYPIAPQSWRKNMIQIVRNRIHSRHILFRKFFCCDTVSDRFQLKTEIYTAVLGNVVVHPDPQFPKTKYFLLMFLHKVHIHLRDLGLM